MAVGRTLPKFTLETEHVRNALQHPDHGRVLRLAAGIKLLFGGHKVTLICLPAEAELINTEGLPRAHAGQGPQGPGRDRTRASCRASSRPAARQTSTRGLRPGRPRHAGAAVPLARRARAARRGREVAGAVHVDHEHAAAAVPEAHPRPRRRRAEARLHRRRRVWDSFDPGMLTLCSPDPQAIRPPEEKVNVLQVTLPTNFKVARFEATTSHRDPAPAREGHRRGALRRRRRQDRAAGEAAACTTRSSCRSPNGRCCWPATIAASPRTACGPPRKRCTATSRPRARSTTGSSTCASSSAPTPDDLVPFEKYAAAAQEPDASGLGRARAATTARPTSSAPTSWCSSSPSRRACSHPTIDATVALVDARLEANRKAGCGEDVEIIGRCDARKSLVVKSIDAAGEDRCVDICCRPDRHVRLR